MIGGTRLTGMSRSKVPYAPSPSHEGEGERKRKRGEEEKKGGKYSI
jgi:hypothetical protein